MSGTRHSFMIAAAQIASVRGDVAANVAKHAAAISAAAAAGVSVVVFPELSLTGYEPDMSASLAFTDDDARLEPLRRLVVDHHLTTMIGAPIRTEDKPAIGAFILGPDGARRVYRKMHLGSSETPFFSPGTEPVVLEVGAYRIGASICADSSQHSHAENIMTSSRNRRGRERQRQYARNPARCQRIIVSGLTIANAPGTEGNQR